jgi:hypothetical protein
MEAGESLLIARIEVIWFFKSHYFIALGSLSHLQNLLANLIELVCPGGQCDDGWMKETARAICYNNLPSNIERGDSNGWLSLALAVDIIPWESSSQRLHHNIARFKAFVATEALESCLAVEVGDSEEINRLITSLENVELLPYRAFESAHVAMEFLSMCLADHSNKKDGRVVLSTLKLIISCLEAASAMLLAVDAGVTLTEFVPFFEKYEHHFRTLSKGISKFRLDEHYRSADLKLQFLKRLCFWLRSRVSNLLHTRRVKAEM